MKPGAELHLEAIDAFLKRLETARDDDELRRFFQEYSTAYDTDVPADPFSAEYREQQFALYRRLAGKEYSPANEHSPFDVRSAAVSPFPYCHGSSQTVGDQLMAIGFLIKTMGLPKGASILEFGPGWGNTTIALAKMGYEVTAIDIEKNFVELIAERARMEGVKVDARVGDFSLIQTLPAKYDAVLFFECFHHCADHMAAIGAFDRVLKPGGLVCFGAEPILPEFPLPWGLRMDGESLWAIRKNGWLELGFNSEYFDRALAKHGWLSITKTGADGPWSKAIVATRASEWSRTYRVAPDQLRSQVGKVSDGSVQSSGGEEGWLVFGPYVDLPAGKWKATLLLDAAVPPRGDIVVDSIANVGALRLLEPRRMPTTAELSVSLSIPSGTRGVEVRVWCPLGSVLKVNGLRLEPSNA